MSRIYSRFEIDFTNKEKSFMKIKKELDYWKKRAKDLYLSEIYQQNSQKMRHLVKIKGIHMK